MAPSFERSHVQQSSIPVGVVGNIRACHARARGFDSPIGSSPPRESSWLGYGFHLDPRVQIPDGEQTFVDITQCDPKPKYFVVTAGFEPATPALRRQCNDTFG